VITGVNGYLGAHTCLLFLKDGGFRVRGTVRDKDNDAKVDPLKAAFGDLFVQLELVNADLTDAASI
jgi:nucleoside-diphosphate-sugar epimerase